MSSNNAIRRGIRQALFAGALATAAGYAPLASAQDDDSEKLEEITVTGSRIVRRDFQSASPIATVGAKYFEQVASVTVESVLNTLPQFVPSITSSSNNPSNGGHATRSAPWSARPAGARERSRCHFPARPPTAAPRR